MIRGLLLALAITGALGRSAAAQPVANETAFSVERFTPAPGAGGFFVLDDGDVLPRLEWSAGFAASLSARPIVLYDLREDLIVREPVSTRLGYQASAAIGLGRRYQVGLTLPVVAFQEGQRLRGIGLDERGLAAMALGDVALRGKARLVGAPRDQGRAVAVAASLSLPTGDQDHFAGEQGPVIGWTLIGSWRNRHLSVGANLGLRLRTEEVVLLSPSQPHGNELTGGGGAELFVPGLPPLSAVGEYVFVVGDATTGSTDLRGPSPREARLGLRWRTRGGWELSVGAGAGTTPDEVGSPAWRAFASARFTTSPLGDADGDRVPDARDRCRRSAEDRDGFADGDGCPDPDNDGDGMPDLRDECPLEPEDFDGDDDHDGCPEAIWRRPASG